jgi:ribosomal protein L7/L12
VSNNCILNRKHELLINKPDFSTRGYCRKQALPETEMSKKHLEEFKKLEQDTKQDYKDKIVVTDNVKNALELIRSLNFIEIMALGQELQKMTGITDEMMYTTIGVTMGGAAGGANVAATTTAVESDAKDSKEGKDKKGGPPKDADKNKSSDIKLTGFAEDKKFHVLKEIRKLKPGMNLIESKKLIDELPSKIGIKLTNAQVDEWKAVLDAVGAKYEVE